MRLGIGLGLAKRWPSGFDPAAKAFFAATGITGVTQQQAINNLVVGLKADGLWSKMKALYPFVTDNRNLVGYSEDFSNVIWESAGVSVTANTTTAPNGTNTADTATIATAGGHNLKQNISVSSNTVYTFSFYVKRGTATGLSYSVYDRTNSQNIVAPTSYYSQTSSSEWARISVTFTTPSNCTQIYIYPLRDGNSTGTVFLWGAQLEVGSTATTYQPIATTQQSYISNQFKYNLVNPVDSDAAFRLVFNGGWTFASTGATPNGTNGWADTKLVPSSVLSLNSTHISTYLRTNISGLNCDISVIQDSVTTQLNIYPRYLDEVYFRVYDNSLATSTNLNSQGLYVANRISSLETRNFKNNTLLIKTESSGAINNSRIIIGAGGNSIGVPNAFSTRQTAFASIGNGLTDTEASNFYSRVQSYQTALFRQV